MRSEKEGAANRQVHRSNARPAVCRQARPSITAWEADEEWSTGKTIAAIIIGTVFLYTFMWLAAAY